MAHLLGVDTGGTYTDAVIVDAETGQIEATAKAPTTHGDLAGGIGAAIERVLHDGDAHHEIALVSLSTTLATNALVEDLTRPAGLIMIGFDPEAVERGGLADALVDVPVLRLDGGHSSHGDEAHPLDVAPLAAWLDAVCPDVDAVAVAGAFSVRNPAHEWAVRDAVVDATGLPVTCSNELSAALNGPKRALTALLNARLVSMVAELLDAAGGELERLGIDAPVMVVRGNGSLVAADVVRHHPIETILSGPAASLVGAAHLAAEPDAVVIDVGGTTTDVAVVRGGELDVSDEGATVGGHRTMVRAVTMATHGLGGDSLVRPAPRAAGAELLIGPRRVMPLVRATATSTLIRSGLERQLARETPAEFDGLFVVPGAAAQRRLNLTDAQQRLLDRVGDAAPLEAVVRSRIDVRTADGLVGRGVLAQIGFTPTDAAAVLGAVAPDTAGSGRAATGEEFDVDVAVLGATLLARMRDRLGRPLAGSAEAISQVVMDTFIRRSADAALASALGADGLDPELATNALVHAARGEHQTVARIDIGITPPIVGLGAPASTFHPRAAELLGTRCVVPDHADVANAVGAAVGRIRAVATVVISAPRRGVFRVHLGDEPTTCFELDEARALATETAAIMVRDAAHREGGVDVEVTTRWEERSALVEDRPYFVEGTVTATAVGRPRLG